MKPSAPAWRAQLTWTQRNGQPHCQAATLLKLDQKTVKLAIGEELPLYQQCSIALFDGNGACRLTAQATAHYLRAARGEKHLSCRWAAPLTHEELDLLTTAGLYERRGGRRAPVALDVPAWPELFAAEGAIPVRIVDLSNGGCCVKSPLAVSVGQRLMIRTWGEQSQVVGVPMRVQWQQALGADVLLGCAFTRRTGYATLASLVEQEGNFAKPAGMSLARGIKSAAGRRT
jgi:PilZ domain